MSAVWAAARAAMARRRLQTLIVGLVVLLSAASGVLALGLLVVSHGPFDAAFKTVAEDWVKDLDKRGKPGTETFKAFTAALAAGH